MIDALRILGDRINNEEWIAHLSLDVYGHSIYIRAEFEHRGAGADISTDIDVDMARKLMKSGELQQAESCSSFNRGMGDGYYIRQHPSISPDAVGYTLGIEGLIGDKQDLNRLISLLREKYDALIEKQQWLEEQMRIYDIVNTPDK